MVKVTGEFILISCIDAFLEKGLKPFRSMRRINVLRHIIVHIRFSRRKFVRSIEVRAVSSSLERSHPQFQCGSYSP